MIGDITQESDPERWQALREIWEADHRPGWVVDGVRQYLVLKLVGNQLVFRPQSGESLYESTGLRLK